MKLLHVHASAVAFLAAKLFAAAAEEQATQPNVIVITAEDLGYGDLACYGHPYAETPNLDELAANGAKVMNFYTASSQSEQSRMGFMTSRLPATVPNYVGDHGFSGLKTVTEIFHDAGYATCHSGEWQMGPLTEGVYGLDDIKFIKASRASNPQGRDANVYLGAIEFITNPNRDRTKPFYLNVFGRIAHAPIRPSQTLIDEFNHVIVDRQKFSKHFRTKLAEREALDPPPDEDLDTSMRSYLADIKALDGQVGKLMQKLDDEGLRDNTIVVFQSTNGAADIVGVTPQRMLGYSGADFRGHKLSTNEGGIRSPFIVSWPAKIPLGVVDMSSTLWGIDILPTLCSLANVNYDPKMYDGQDKSDALNGIESNRDSPIYWQKGFGTPRLAMRYGKWKMFRNVDNGNTELYDLSVDPGEMTDLTKQDGLNTLSAEMAKYVEELTPTLVEQINSWGDTLPAEYCKMDQRCNDPLPFNPNEPPVAAQVLGLPDEPTTVTATPPTSDSTQRPSLRSSQAPSSTATPTVSPSTAKPTVSPPPTPEDAKKPNIILMLTDDQDVVLGSLDYMPILKRVLMERGTTFRNAFVHTPICCPSRMSIMSGRYLHNLNNGNPVNNSVSGGCDGENWRNDAEEETFAIHAKAAGYATSYAGKYLSAKNDIKGSGDPLRGTPGCPTCLRVPPGYDKWLVQRQNAIYYDYHSIQSDNGGVDAWQTFHGSDYYQDYFPDLVANRTLKMLEEFTSEDVEERMPFLAVVAWPTPHGPFTPAPWAENLHDGAQAPRTPNYNASSEYMELKHWLLRKQSPIDKSIARGIDKRYEMRLESLRSVDEHVGMIVDLLEEKGELDNTYIIYTSDNGFNGGQHRIPGDKRHMYEHDIRVPFVVTGPGIPRNVTTDRPVLNVDIAPTIYELISGDTEPRPNMDGRSIVPYLRSLQKVIENDHKGNGATAIEDPHHREDFLVSYYGEGNPECGLKIQDCSKLDPTDFHINDSSNNTYHCVRSLTIGDFQSSSLTASAQKDSVYCRFDDSEQFVEYYDHIVDPWQLTNRASNLTVEERDQFEKRLSRLRECRGESCRNGM